MHIAISWGTICVLQDWVRAPWKFYVLRFLLGAFEAGFYPGAILHLTQCCPTCRRARAFGTFISAPALAGVLGGLLAGIAMSNVHAVNGMHGWPSLFIL